jgi:CRISPR-associated endonuclease/helicase Cas3
VKDLSQLDLKAFNNVFLAHVKATNREELQNLATHLFESAGLAGKFAGKIGLYQVGFILGLLHDFGKYSLEFQTYIKSATAIIDQDDEEWVDFNLLKGKIDHSTAGAQYAYQALRKFGAAGQGELCGQIIALCIASHHSGLIDCLDPDGNDNFAKRISKEDVKTHLSECLKNADKEILDVAKELLDGPFVQQMLSAIFKFIKKPNPQDIFSLEESFTLGVFTRFLFSCLIDADRINSAEFEEPERKILREKQQVYFDWDVPINRLDERLETFEVEHPIDEIRQNISDTCYNRAFDKQGIYSLTVPTGGGKTLASLRYALHHAKQHKLDRIIYVIPYTSIIEQNAQAVRDIVQRDDDPFPWVLEHHSNLEPEMQTWHSKLVAENWDAPIVFTTMVQYLETLFSAGTRSIRRMHQLAKSVLIFDEIQTLPINCTHMFCNSLNFLSQHASTTAVLCTATQPLLKKLPTSEYGELQLAENAEIVEDTTQLFENLKRVNVINRYKAGGWSQQEIITLVEQRFIENRSCLVVVNTKAWAKNIFEECQHRVEPNALFHLSTSQCAAHRKTLLKEIRERLKNGLPVICISTQLIEAGVDISFANVIRFLAGIDSIAQAGGRCNRSGELKTEQGGPRRGTVEVINPTEEFITSLVDIKVGQEISRRVFQDLGIESILSPKSIDIYFQYFFTERQEQMVYPMKKTDDCLLNILANNTKNNGATLNKKRRVKGKLPLLGQSFMTAGKAFKAIDAPTNSVIVPYNDEAKAIIAALCGTNKAFGAADFYQHLKKAQQYSVNVFPNVWRALLENEAVFEVQADEGIYYLHDRFYSANFGLTSEVVSEYPSNIC